MNSKTGFGSFRFSPRISPATDLQSWRTWLVDAMTYFAAFAFPLSMLATFPVFIQKKMYELIALDVGFYLFLIFSLFLRGRSYKSRAYIWMVLVYMMAISFHVALGPHYARPAWLVMAAVMAAFIFGTRAAGAAVMINTAILLALYWTMAAAGGPWDNVYSEPFGQWIMFIVNISIITLVCALPVGFLLNRLDVSLKHERKSLESLSEKAEKLQAANIALQKEKEERKETEKALTASEEKFRNLVENVDEVIYALDEKGILTYVNPAIIRILGYPESEIVGRPFSDFIFEKDLERQRNRFKRLLAGPIGSDEYRLVNKTGEIRWVHSSTRPVFKNGTFTRLEGVLFDITDRKQAEEAMIEAQLRYRSLFNSKINLVFVLDDRGNFIAANDLAFDLFGYTREDLANLNYLQLLHPDQSLAPLAKALKEILETGAQLELLEVKLKNRSGETIYVQSGGTLIPGKREILGVARDITDQKMAEEEKKKLENQLVHAQKMEAVGILAGGIAHDFNNSLQGILGYAQMLLLDMPGDTAESGKLRQIEAAALRASELTRQLLTFSRRIESKPRPIDLKEEVRQVESLLRRTIPRMIDIELHMKSDFNIINADASQIEQVMMNLCINARDAMPGGGKLMIETENVNLDKAYCRTHLGAVPGNYVMLGISDNGTGMDKDTLEHIFEPFYTTKDPGKGTGLGLAIVYGIVKDHGGYIACYSELGEGTIFRIYFPVIERDRLEDSEQRENAEIRGGTDTILIVDDDQSIRELAEEMLRRFGYTVIAAADGEEALEIYRKRQMDISLVILDLIMPGMGGHKCLAEILRIDPSQRVIIASGYSAGGQTAEALKSGSKGYLKKPFKIGPMLKMVRQVLDQP
jgi:two-component system cell cycle sensor histidine kinase/response regulator CckA